MSKVYVEGDDHLISQMFKNNGWELTESLEEADLVCFEGGLDVTPSLYGEENISSYNDVMVDWNSIVLYNNAKRLLKPMVGICRGGQFLNVMAGGKMIQHIDGHGIRDTHEIIVSIPYKGLEKFQVTSTHHQAMVPNLYRSNVIGWVPQGDNLEWAEIIHHWQENTLSFQPHPEYVHTGHQCQTLFFNLIGGLLR